MNLTEDYCSFELSKLLKEKGFDEDTERVYERNIMACRYEDYPMPTHQMAIKWLREERWKYIEISFSVTLNGEPQYNFGVLNRSAQWVYRHKQPFSTYEEAVEAAIKYSLENLI